MYIYIYICRGPLIVYMGSLRLAPISMYSYKESILTPACLCKQLATSTHVATLKVCRDLSELIKRLDIPCNCKLFKI